MDPLLRDFLDDSAENLRALDEVLVQLAARPQRVELLAAIFRVFHTVKGTCGFLGLERLGRLAHAAENVLERLRDGTIPVTPAAIALIGEYVDRMRLLVAGTAANGTEPDLEAGAPAPALERSGIAALPDPRSIRVPVEQVDRLVAALGDALGARTALAATAAAPALARLDDALAALRRGLDGLRTAPLGVAWIGLHRLIRDLSAGLGKRIELSLAGAEIEVDRRTVETLKDAMVHIVRNAADHGIEAPAERAAAGKPETGRITVRAARRDGGITIEVVDDGRGLPLSRIRERGVAVGLVSADRAAGMDDEAVARLIFEPGLTTAIRVTEVSGRGIGLDAARSALESLGGSITVRSVRGRGAIFALAVPDRPAAVGDPQPVRPTRLLLVDDRGGSRDLVEPLLAAAGYQISTAADVAAVATLGAAGSKFDLVLVDPWMPGLDVADLAERLATEPGSAGAPVLALLAEDARPAPSALGAAACVVRSDSVALLSRVAELTGRRGGGR
jgi:two-component system chemotaxis sensor kinase CheA